MYKKLLIQTNYYPNSEINGIKIRVSRNMSYGGNYMSLY